jgi:NADH:ubiquinone oxidoreductase subunit 4 (subunit M)
MVAYGLLTAALIALVGISREFVPLLLVVSLTPALQFAMFAISRRRLKTYSGTPTKDVGSRWND